MKDFITVALSVPKAGRATIERQARAIIERFTPCPQVARTVRWTFFEPRRPVTQKAATDLETALIHELPRGLRVGLQFGKAD